MLTTIHSTFPTKNVPMRRKKSLNERLIVVQVKVAFLLRYLGC